MTPLATLFRARRDWVVVPAAVMISLGLSVLYLSVAPRTYVATANVFVSMQSSDAATTYMRGAFSTIRAQSYTALATSPGVLRRAIDSASPGYPVERLAREVTATILPQTVVLQIAVSSTDPERASRFAEAVSEAVAGRGTELEQAGSRNDAPISLTPLQDVQGAPTVPVSPNVPRDLYPECASWTARGVHDSVRSARQASHERIGVRHRGHPRPGGACPHRPSHIDGSLDRRARA